jgi:hypothetical protein
MPTLIRLAVASAALGVACGGGARPAERAAERVAAPAVPPSDTTGLLRVRFARGTTSGILNDSLQAGETRGYLIGAEQGQVMMVHAITWPVRQGEAPPATATVRVYAVAGGSELTTASGPGPPWSGRLPGTGDFVVRVNATQPTAYTLAVQIPRRLSVGEGDPTAAITGTAPSRAPVDYLIEGEGGMTLAAAVRDGDSATLHMYGLDDGKQLAPLSERRKLWAGTLPTSQDYVISVVPADEGARYELTITLR